MDRAEQDILAGCRLTPLAVRGDARGSLVPIEAGVTVPFAIERVYTVFGTLPGVRRGFHAHRRLQQLVIAVHGGCTIVLDDGRERRRVPLNKPDLGLIIGPMIWREMEDFTADCVLMVLANAHYDEADYIRDYQLFVALGGDAGA